MGNLKDNTSKRLDLRTWNKWCHLLCSEIRKDDTAPIFRPGVGGSKAGGEEGGGGGQQQAVAGQHLEKILFRATAFWFVC